MCCVSFACNKMQNQIFELPEVRKSALFLKSFQTGKRRWRDSKSIECLNDTKEPLTMKQTFPELAEMCGKCPVKGS